MTSIINDAFSIISLVTVILAAFYIARQKMSYFTTIRTYFFIVCLAFATMIIFSIYSRTDLLLMSMRISVTSCIVAAVFAGVAVANLTDYPKAGSFKELFVAFINRPKPSTIAYMTIMVIVLALTWVPQLYPSVPQFNTGPQYDVLSGGEIVVGRYELWFGIVMLAMLISFLLYPVLKLVLLSKTVKTKKVGLSIRMFGICLGAIAFSLFVFNVISAAQRYYLTELGYFFDSIFFCLIAYSFEGSTILSAFIEDVVIPPKPPELAPPVCAKADVFSTTLGLKHEQMEGINILLEFDPQSRYENVIKDFATEALDNTKPTVIFTRRGSAIHSSLSEYKGVKFFCLTENVSVPKEFSENQVLLPSRDTSLMLGILDSALKAHPQVAINVVFDNLSDLLLSIGFDKTYRFIKFALEILYSPKNTVLFLLNQTAQDPKITSHIRNLFGNQVSFGKEGMQVTKLSEPEPMIEMIKSAS